MGIADIKVDPASADVNTLGLRVVHVDGSEARGQ
jgi:hypothetical protein